VDLSYHVAYDDHFYSVHFSLIGEQLDLRATEATVEIFRRGTRIESYPRSFAKWKYSTLKHHMPRAHLDQVEWTPERLMYWASKTGPQTVALPDAIMASKAHPQQGFKACLGVLRLAKQYPAERVAKSHTTEASGGQHFYSLRRTTVAQGSPLVQDGWGNRELQATQTQAALPAAPRSLSRCSTMTRAYRSPSTPARGDRATKPGSENRERMDPRAFTAAACPSSDPTFQHGRSSRNHIHYAASCFTACPNHPHEPAKTQFS